MPKIPTCACGLCPLCRHRENVRARRADGKARREAAGFTGYEPRRSRGEQLADHCEELLFKRNAMNRRLYAARQQLRRFEKRERNGSGFKSASASVGI